MARIGDTSKMWKNDVLVLHYYKSTIDGVMTSMIDTFFNLRTVLQGHRDIKIVLVCPELYLLDKEDYYDENQVEWYEYTSDRGLDVVPYKADDKGMDFHFRAFRNELTTAIPFLRFNRNFGDFNLIHSITQDVKNVFNARTIVCSARLIYEILMGEDIELQCDKICILDSLDTYKSKMGTFPDFDDLFDTMLNDSNICQLSNPANFKETKYKQVEYYQKLNYRRLNALKQTGYFNGKTEYTFNRSEKKKTEIIDSYHFENIGKGIFEHLHFGIPVHYKTDGMFTKDGLWFYLKRLGIDPEKEQTIGKIDLKKMFMNDILTMHDPFLKQKKYIKDELIREIL